MVKTATVTASRVPVGAAALGPRAHKLSFMSSQCLVSVWWSDFPEKPLTWLPLVSVHPKPSTLLPIAGLRTSSIELYKSQGPWQAVPIANVLHIHKDKSCHFFHMTLAVGVLTSISA